MSKKKKSKSKIWLWVLGWIIIFPLPLTILLLKKSDDINPKLKYTVMVIAWAIYIPFFVLCLKSGDSSTVTRETANYPISDNEEVTSSSEWLTTEKINKISDAEETTDNYIFNTTENIIETTAKTTYKQTTEYKTTNTYKGTSQYKTTTQSKQNYILNTNTMKFHSPYCRSIKDIKDENKESYYGTRDDVMKMGYSPCGICKP